VQCNHRLPQSDEKFQGRKLGAWTVKLRGWEKANQLAACQLAALRSIPMWPSTQVVQQQPVPARAAPSAVQAAPSSAPPPSYNDSRRKDVTDKTPLI